MFSRHVLGLAMAIALSSPAFADSKEVVHIQIDKPMYRLGETVWYRLHSSAGFQGKYTVELRDSADIVAATAKFKGKKAPSGSFLISKKWLGGNYRIVARANDKVVHEVPLRVYDLKTPALKLSLQLIGDYYHPGDTVIASVKATDLRGRPIVGADIQYLARFGPLVVEGVGGQSNEQGRLVVRFQVPKEAQVSGTVAVGLECKKGMAAVAAKVPVSASVGRVDFFPEGGAVTEQGFQRMAVLVRNLNGAPIIAEGRVYDGDECVETFKSNSRGLAVLNVKYKEKKKLTLKIDRPTGVKKSFPLPAPTGHKYSIRINRSYKTNQWISVLVNGKKMKKSARLFFVWNGKIVKKEKVKISKDWSPATANFEIPKYHGIGSVYLIEDGRAYARAKFFFGEKSPYEVFVSASEDKNLPGQAARVEITTTRYGAPAPADLAISIFNKGALDSGRLQLTSFPTRALFQPHVDAVLIDAQDLMKEGAAAYLERDAFLISHMAYAYPKEGLPLEKTGLPALDAGRVSIPPVSPRPPISAKALAGSVTKARKGKLQKLLERAHFTRGVPPRANSNSQFRRIGPKKKQFKTPGLGKKRKHPQKEKISWSQIDTRDTLYWNERLRTNAKGKKVLTFRLSHEVSELEFSAQGLSGSVAVAVSKAVKAKANFQSNFAFPSYMRVGDLIELEMECEIRDGRKDPVKINMFFPPSLKALDKVNLTLNPKKNKLKHRFRFQVLSATQGARLTVVTTRRMFQDIQHRDFAVGERELTLTVGSTGFADGVQSAELRIPKNAVKGSARVQSRVLPRVKKVAPVIATSVESVESVLREPHGCFEQTSSSHYPNLEALTRLKKEGKDGKVMEKAFKYAHSGFKRLKTFQTSSGGFTLWAGKGKPSDHYTAMGLIQMALYARHFDGRGSYEMQKALNYLKKKSISSVYKYYVLYAVSEYASHTEEGQGQAIMDKLLKKIEAPETNYEKALLANALLYRTDEASQKLFHKLAKELLKAQGETGGVASKGASVMHSQGSVLTLETTALAAVVFKKANEEEAAETAARYLLKQKQVRGGWWGTQGTALSIRALTHVPAKNVLAMSNETLKPIQFSAAGLKKSWVPDTEKADAYKFSAPVPENLGKVQFSLAIPKGHQMEYSFGLSYRIANPVSSKDAPFQIKTRIASTVTVGKTTPLSVSIKKVVFKEKVSTSGSGFAVSKKANRRKSIPKGQYVASIGIPGGCIVEDMKQVLIDTKAQFAEFKNGALCLYWEQHPGETSFSFDIKAVVAGNYVGSPTVYYPYYSANREAYANGLKLKVLGGRYQVSDEEAAAASGLGK